MKIRINCIYKVYLQSRFGDSKLHITRYIYHHCNEFLGFARCTIWVNHVPAIQRNRFVHSVVPEVASPFDFYRLFNSICAQSESSWVRMHAQKTVNPKVKNRTYFFSPANTMFSYGKTRPLTVTRFGSNSRFHSLNVGAVRCASSMRLLNRSNFWIRAGGPIFVWSAIAFIVLHKQTKSEFLKEFWRFNEVISPEIAAHFVCDASGTAQLGHQ